MKKIKIPKEIERKIRGFKEFEASRIIGYLVGDKKKILNIGCFWGRDYYYLSSKGKEVINIDLENQNLPNMTIHDITKGEMPFDDKTFDVILIPEVLEHIFEDFLTLKKLKRILKDDGKIIITVPFYSDGGDYHVRIYSPDTIKKLVNHSGFRIEEYIERGGLITFSKLVAIFSILFTKINKSFMENVLENLSLIDFNLGKGGNFLFGFSGSYGAYIKISKTNLEKNISEINKKEFCRQIK